MPQRVLIEYASISISRIIPLYLNRHENLTFCKEKSLSSFGVIDLSLHCHHVSSQPKQSPLIHTPEKTLGPEAPEPTLSPWGLQSPLFHVIEELQVVQDWLFSFPLLSLFSSSAVCWYTCLCTAIQTSRSRFRSRNQSGNALGFGEPLFPRSPFPLIKPFESLLRPTRQGVHWETSHSII